MDAPAASPAPPASPSAPTTAATSPLIHLVDPTLAPKPAPAAVPKPAPQADWALKPQERFEQQQQQVDALYNQIRPGLKAGEKVDDATYAKMTYAERVAYAEQFEWRLNERQPADPAAPPVSDPNAERFTIDDVDATKAEWRDALSFKAAEDAKRLSLPATAKDYKLELPKDLKLPAGVEFKFNENDPVLGPVLKQAQTWAKAND